MRNKHRLLNQNLIPKSFFLVCILLAAWQAGQTQCNGIEITSVQSFYPNPDMEGRDCCPESVTPVNEFMECIHDHVQGSDATIDYHVYNCSNSLNNDCVPHPPANTPDQNGMLGFVYADWWREYLGTCMPNTLVPGVNYTLKFKLGFGTPKPPCENDGVLYEYASYSPVSFAIYGTNSCANMPFSGTGCPSTVWTKLGDVSLTGTNEWIEGMINFTVPEAISAVVIGPDCLPIGGLNGYYFLDDVVLNETNAFSPQFDINASGHPCSGQSLSVGYYAAFSYQWFYNNNAIAGATSTSYNIPVGQEGAYFVRVSYGNDCTESNVFTYEVPAYETYLNEELCYGESFGVGNSVFTQSGSYVEELLTANGCDSIVHLELLIREALYIDSVHHETILCAGGTTDIIAYSNAGLPVYTWSDGGTGVNRMLAAGTHEVMVTDDLGCTSAPYSFLLTEPDSLRLYYAISHETCVGFQDGTAMPFVEGGVKPYQIKYEFGDYLPFIDSILIVDLVPDTYSMTVKDSNACSLQTTFEILPREPVEVFIYPIDDLAIGDSAVLEIGSEPKIEFANYDWIGNQLSCYTCPNPVIYPLTPPYNRYLVTVIEAEAGCQYQANLEVGVHDGVYIANAFSPNADGINDHFFIQSNPESVIEVKEFMVYDRWGELLFLRKSFLPNDTAFAWDGTLRKKAMPAGVYVYLAKIELINGEEVIHKGTVTLLR